MKLSLSAGLAALTLVLLAACSPKLEGSGCVTDSNCPSQLTCRVNLNQPGPASTCQPRPSCSTKCGGGLACGYDLGNNVACVCPANNQFFDGGYVLSVNPAQDASSFADAGIRPNGGTAPGCAFRTISDALDVANRIATETPGGAKVQVAVRGNGPVILFNDERFPLQIAKGVRVTGILDDVNTKVLTILQASDAFPTFTSVAELSAGSGLESFIVSAPFVDATPMVVTHCPDGGAPPSLFNLIVSQTVDAGAGAGAGSAGVALMATDSCGLDATKFVLSSPGTGLTVAGTGTKVSLSLGQVLGGVAGIQLVEGSVAASNVQVATPGIGILIPPGGGDTFLTFGDGGIRSAFGLVIQGADGGLPDGGAVAVFDGVADVSLQNSLVVSYPADGGRFAGIVLDRGAVSADNVQVLGDPLAYGGIFARGANTSLTLKNVQVSGFLTGGRLAEKGLYVIDGAKATLTGGVFDSNDVAVSLADGGLLDATGTQVTQTGQTALFLDNSTAALHGVTFSQVSDGGTRGVGVSSTNFSTVSIDGPSSFSGFFEALNVTDTTLSTHGDGGAPVRVFDNGTGLTVTNSAGTLSQVTFNNPTDVAIANAGTTSGPVSFRGCTFGVGATGSSGLPSFAVTQAEPLASGPSVVVADSVFSGGFQGLELNNSSAAASPPNISASILNNEFKGYDNFALHVLAPGKSSITVDGNTIHDSNVSGKAVGAVVFTSAAPSTFLFQRNKVYSNGTSQVGFESTAAGTWALDASLGDCSLANQLTCYGTPQNPSATGLRSVGTQYSLAITARATSWQKQSPTAGTDYVILGTSTTIDASNSCPASTIVCP